MCVCVCACVCACVCWERERTVSFSRPAYPQIHLSVLQTVCVFSDLWSDYLVCFVLLFVCLFVFFCGWPPINHDKKVSKDNFSIIYLSRTVCELTFSIKQMHCKTGTLWHSDASILFTSANVVLDKRHSDAFILSTSAKFPSASAKAVLDKKTIQNFFKSYAPCVLLSAMPTCHFLNGWCLVEACFLDLLHFSSSSSVPCSHLLPTALFTNPPYVKMVNFR